MSIYQGGGVELSDLALATATENTVLNGKTFYAGNTKEIRTGSALNQTTNVTADNLPSGITAYNNLGQFITGIAKNELKYTKIDVSFSGNSYNEDKDKIYTYNSSFNIFAVAYSIPGNSNNFGGVNQTKYSSTTVPSTDIIIGDNTQFILNYYAVNLGGIAVIVTKTSDTQITVKCLSAQTNRNINFYFNLFLIGT